MNIPVRFVYLTGLRRVIFSNAQLVGTWDEHGRFCEQWTTHTMQPIQAEDGCPAFEMVVELQEGEVGRQFRWGVLLDGPQGKNLWGIMSEAHGRNTNERSLRFVLRPVSGDEAQKDPLQEERYHLTNLRRLGANKYYHENVERPAIQFALWAPSARAAELVFGEFGHTSARQTGYIADDGTGMDPALPPIALQRCPEGIWVTDPLHPILMEFSTFERRLYMFRITKDDGSVAYRTDVYARSQIGQGTFDPGGELYQGGYRDLDRTKGCSVVIDPETVSRQLQEEDGSRPELISAEEFWRDEMNPNRPLPCRLEDLVIYEIHIGYLGYGKVRANANPQFGDFADAVKLMDYLVDLGVNAVELLPELVLARAEEHGTTHFFAPGSSAGGRDHLKHFVRECHRRGIAVILDIVYNHYSSSAERAQWMYDSEAHERNIYYWYEGRPDDYTEYEGASTRSGFKVLPGYGGYVDNVTTSFAPRYCEEMVRKLFISSAVALLEEFHVDGFHFDQTASIHAYNSLYADGRSLANVNISGAKFLRQCVRTLRLIRPQVILVAEEHSECDKVTEPPEQGGLGFDAVRSDEFYRHLVGAADFGPSFARLIWAAGRNECGPLAMDAFASALERSARKRVVYHAEFNQAGVASGTHRTIAVAANHSPLIEETRRFAEARSRWAVAMSVLSAGTPLFLMGEEIGAIKDVTYNQIAESRENLVAERYGSGKRLFAFYKDLINLRLSHDALRSRDIEVIHVHNDNRVIAFRRWSAAEQFVIVASLNNVPFQLGYVISHPTIRAGRWGEVLNSDSSLYGGSDMGYRDSVIHAAEGRIEVVIPANAALVFQWVG